MQQTQWIREASLGIGAAALGAMLAIVATIGLSEPVSELPLPIGLLVAGAVATQLLLLMLPWTWQFALVAAIAAVQIATISVGSSSVPATVLVIAPFAVRCLVFTRREVRPRWSWPEYVIVAWIALHFVSTALFSVDVKSSAESAGLLTLGVVTYLAVYTGTATRERLIFATRAVLVVSVIASLLALAAYAAYLAVGSTIGIAFQPEIGYVPRGVAFEPNLLGSTSAGAAIAFLVLMRNPNPVVKQSQAVFGYWICLAAAAISLARGGAIGFLVAFVATLVFRGYERRSSPTRLVSVLPTLAMIGVLAVGSFALVASARTDTPLGDVSDQVSTKWEQLITGEGTVRQRLGETVIGFDDLGRSPIIGLGTDSFGQRHIDYRVNPPAPAYLGDLYFRTLYETGIVGVMLLVLFVVAIVWPAPALSRNRSDLAPVARSLAFGFLAMAVAYAATDGLLLAWPWVFIGVARAAGHLAAGDGAERSPTA